MALSSLLQFFHGGMDFDDAPVRVAPGDFITGYNIRASGTVSGEDGYITNIESNILITGSLHDGINKIVGAQGFEQIRKAIWFIWNSEGYHQIGVLDYDTNTLSIVFENLTNSADVDILPLTANNYVLDIKLVNNDFLIWNDGNAPIGYTQLSVLESGGYGTLIAEDLSLSKPQSLKPPTGEYVSDLGRASNFLRGNLFQADVQWIGFDYHYSAWSTMSKRIIPIEESTPAVGTDVTQNNGIVWSVEAGSERVANVAIGVRIGTDIYNTVKTVDRSYIIALPNTAVDVTNGIFEAYDPATNLYSFVFYNEEISIPVNPLETDLLYDYIWPSGATEVVNGNIIANGDIKAGYDRPATQVSLQAVGYDPNINVPTGAPDTFYRGNYTFTANAAVGGIRFVSKIQFGGSPQTNDIATIMLVNWRDASDFKTYSYTVPSGQSGNLAAVIASFAATIDGGSYTNNGDGTYSIYISQLNYSVFSAYVTIYNAGLTVSRSIHSILDNSSYQLALAYYDEYGRAFPIDTDNTFIVKTPSYAQVNGNAIEISWQILTSVAPAGAVSYQWVITPNNTTLNLLDVLATPIVYKGTWDAHGNSPMLLPGTGTVGWAYQITTPSLPTDYRNLGNGTPDFNTGDYVVYNGKSWDILAGTFGDLTGSGNILALKIDPLRLFNDRYTNAGFNTVLGYDFSQGDRCTLHYYLDGTTPVYINTPCVDLEVYGYDAGTYLVKMEKSATFDESTIAGKDVFIRLYSPKPHNNSTDTTVWFEIGEQFPIVDGLHTVLSGNITDGDVYYKTRSYTGAVDPNNSYEVLATDFNFSDFYASAFWSKGRPRAYNDELEKTERKAIITWSDQYVLGSKRNGLTRFYPANVYGVQGGETSDNYGAISKMLQVNNELVVIQQLNHGSVPVYQVVYTDQVDKSTVAVSQKLFNPIRYTSSRHIGVGTVKESIAIYNNIIYWVDPNRSQPVRWAGDGCLPISFKMSKYFKDTLQRAVGLGYKIIGWYDIYNDEYVISVQQPGGIISTFSFNTENWQYLEPYTIAPGDITISTPPSHSTPSYDSGTGIVTLTPDADYVGSDTMVISFPVPGGGTVNKNVCFNWIAGSGNVNPFAFGALTGVPLGIVETSNTISVTGNDYPVPISITGDSGLGYSINGGAFTSSPGTVNAGDIVQVRVTSSGSLMTATSCTLTIDSQSATFTVTTRAAGNFTVYAQYGMSVVSVQDGSATGVPAGFNPCNLSPGQSESLAYTALVGSATDTISVTLTGTPAIPGHTRLFISVNGVNQDTRNLTGGGSFSLQIGIGATDPDLVVVGIETF